MSLSHASASTGAFSTAPSASGYSADTAGSSVMADKPPLSRKRSSQAVVTRPTFAEAFLKPSLYQQPWRQAQSTAVATLKTEAPTQLTAVAASGAEVHKQPTAAAASVPSAYRQPTAAALSNERALKQGAAPDIQYDFAAWVRHRPDTPAACSSSAVPAGGGNDGVRGGRWSAVHAYRQAREAATRAADDHMQGTGTAFMPKHGQDDSRAQGALHQSRHQPSSSNGPASDWRSWLLPDNNTASSSSHSTGVSANSTSSLAFGSLNAAHAPGIPGRKLEPAAALAGPQADWRSWLSPDLVPGIRSESTRATFMQHTHYAHAGSSDHGNLASEGTEPAAPSGLSGMSSIAPSQEVATASSLSAEAGMLHGDVRFARNGDAYTHQEAPRRHLTHPLQQGSSADHRTASDRGFASVSRSKAQDQESDRISRIMSIKK